MSTIKLGGTFSIMPEGVQVLKITGIKYDERFGKLDIAMQNEKGQRHTERFSFIKVTGETNDKALSAFSYFAKIAMNDFSLDEIDPNDLIGHFMECTIEHTVVESNKEPGKMMTFTKIVNKAPSEGWEETEEEELPASDKPEPAKDLKSLLGRLG